MKAKNSSSVLKLVSSMVCQRYQRKMEPIPARIRMTRPASLPSPTLALSLPIFGPHPKGPRKICVRVISSPSPSVPGLLAAPPSENKLLERREKEGRNITILLLQAPKLDEGGHI